MWWSLTGWAVTESGENLPPAPIVKWAFACWGLQGSFFLLESADGTEWYMRAPHFRASHPILMRFSVFTFTKGGERVWARQTWCRVGAVGIEAVFPSPVQLLPLLRRQALGICQDLCLFPKVCHGEDLREQSPVRSQGRGQRHRCELLLLFRSRVTTERDIETQ